MLPLVTRRRFLTAGLATAALALAPGGARAAAQVAAPRVAVIDWAMLESLLSIGLTPVAATELLLYRRLVVEPPVPGEVQDLGLRGSPNLELLSLCRPDLIVSSPWYEGYRDNLERIDPVLSVPIYQPDRRPFEAAEAAALQLGSLLDREAEAAAVVGEAEAELARTAEAVAPFADRPHYLINIGDARHFRAFGPDSMFGEVLERIGLANAWGEGTRYRAQAQVQLEALAQVPDARLVVVGPLPPEARRVLPRSGLWRALPAVREGRVSLLPPVNPFGGLPAARRFARLLAQALPEEGRRAGGALLG